MSIALVINGTTFEYPQTNDQIWGPDGTAWAQAVTTGMLQKAGGLFQLLAEVDFGTAFGMKSLYYKSRTANIADAGQFRLARADVVSWRNQANDGNLDLSVNSSNKLLFNGASIVDGITALTGDGTATGPGSAALTLTTVNSNVGTFASVTVNAKGLVTAATALSGDATTSGAALTLATVNSDVGSFGGATTSGTFTVNAKGLITAASSTSIQIAESQVTNLVSDLAAKQSTSLTSAHVLVGNVSNVATDVAMSGDITISNAGVTAIGSNKVTNGMLAQVSTAIFKGRTTAGTGNVEDLTVTQATALLNVMTGDAGSGGLKGLVPAQVTGDSAKFLKGDGTWGTPAGAGDVVGPGSATDGHVVFFNGSTGKIIKDSGLTLSGSNSGDVTLVNSTNGLTISSQALTMALAASGASGTVSATTQTFTGIKTFETQLIGKGTATNDSAAAGYIGEVITASGSSTSSNAQGTVVNLCSISLTAGDWDVYGNVSMSNATVSSPTRYRGGISLTTATLETGSGGYANLPASSLASICTFSVGYRRISVASTTTVYLVGECSGSSGTFSTDTSSIIYARRAR